MHNPVQFINVRGEMRGVLLTPSLYKVCSQNGWDIRGNSEDDIFPSYVKLIYAAAHNYHQVQLYDNPALGECDITLMDIEIWATLNRADFNELVIKSCELLTGKPLKQLVEDSKTSEKKKKNGIWSGIIRRIFS